MEATEVWRRWHGGDGATWRQLREKDERWQWRWRPTFGDFLCCVLTFEAFYLLCFGIWFFLWVGSGGWWWLWMRFLRFSFYLLYNNGLTTYNNFVKLILMYKFYFLIADVALCHVNDTPICKGLVIKLVVSLALLISLSTHPPNHVFSFIPLILLFFLYFYFYFHYLGMFLLL